MDNTEKLIGTNYLPTSGWSAISTYYCFVWSLFVINFFLQHYRKYYVFGWLMSKYNKFHCHCPYCYTNSSFN